MLPLQKNPDIESEKNLVLKKFVTNYLYTVSAILAVFFAVFWYCDLKLFASLQGIGVLLHIFFIVYFYNHSFSIIKLLINFYLIFISIFIFILVSLIWKASNPLAFIWYPVFPLGAMTVFNDKKIAVYWSAYILILSILTVVFPLNYLYPINIDSKSILYLSITTIICVLYLIIFIIYYHNKISKTEDNLILTENIETENLLLDSILIEKETKPTAEAQNDESSDKYEDLFKKITDYFDEHKPFKDPELNIQQLAVELNSNSTYISRAINLNINMNFKTFVNKYRIEQIKEQLNENDSKYTLMYIYTNAGFKYQSTFNKVFKQIENITPSEYIAQQNNKNNIN